MNLVRLRSWIWLLTLIPDNVLSSDFTEVPQDQKYCLNDLATFTWQYSPKSAVDRIYFLKGGNVFVTYYMARNTDEKRDPPADRTEVLQATQTEASIRIQNLTTSDSGRYEILLSGPGSRHSHNITVLTKADLTPTLKLNNVQTTNGVILRDNDQVTNYIVSVATSKKLPANITILLNGEEKEKCTQTRDCVYALDKEYLLSNSNIISIQIDYGVCGVCGVIENELTLIGNNDGSTISMSGISTSSPTTGVPPDQDTCVACIVVPIILLVILSAVLVVVWWMRRKHMCCFKDVEKSDTVRVIGNSVQYNVKEPTNQDGENAQPEAKPLLTDPAFAKMTAAGPSTEVHTTDLIAEGNEGPGNSKPSTNITTAPEERSPVQVTPDVNKVPDTDTGHAARSTLIQPQQSAPDVNEVPDTDTGHTEKSTLTQPQQSTPDVNEVPDTYTEHPERSTLIQPQQSTPDVNEVPDTDTGHPEKSTLIQPQQPSDSVTKSDTTKNKQTKTRHKPNLPTVGVKPPGIVHPETAEPHTEAKHQQLASEASQALVVDNSRHPHPGPNRGTAAANTADDPMIDALVSEFGTKLGLESEGGNSKDNPAFSQPQAKKESVSSESGNESEESDL